MAENLCENCGPSSRVLSKGPGWLVRDVICTAGPKDKPFEEKHSTVAIAIVVGGTFQYRSSNGHAFMAPGSLLLGNAGDHFECGHEHGVGDRCIAFSFDPEYFEGIAGGRRFRVPRVPAAREISRIVAFATSGMTGDRVSWEEVGVRLASIASRISSDLPPASREAAPSAIARVTRSVRLIEENLGVELTLEDLANRAGLSPYHFLRIFEGLTGVTPHQYVRRTRLREAAKLLSATKDPVVHIALHSGFGDLANFNRSFRQEFGLSPMQYRRQ